MAEFIEVIKQRERMCCCSKCDSCLIHKENNGYYLDCSLFIVEHPQEAEEIIMNWAKEHPIKTNADKFKEVFGFEPCTDLCVLEKNIKCKECKYKGTTENESCCSKWWEEEYKEPKGVK